MRCGRAVLEPHDDAQAAAVHLVERVLVGDVVADEHHERVVGHRCFLHQPAQRPALVPVRRRAQLEDLLAAGHAQCGVGVRDGGDGGLERRHVGIDGGAVVHRDGEALALGPCARRRVDGGDEQTFGTVERRERRSALGELLAGAVGGDDVEAVAAGHPQPGRVDERRDVVEVTAADDPDGARPCECRQLRCGLAREERVLGTVDDRGERAVVVEEHRDGSVGEHAGHVGVLQRQRQLGQQRRGVLDAAQSTVEQLQVGGVGHHQVGVRSQLTGAPGAVDAHHGADPTGAGRPHTGNGVLEHRGARRFDAESTQRLQEHRGVGLAGQAQRGQVDAVDAHVEQVGDAGRVEHHLAVPARRDDRAADPGSAELLEEPARRRVGRDAVATDRLGERSVLAVAERADGVVAGRVVGSSARQLDAPGGEQRRDPVVAADPVDVVAVVGVGERRGGGAGAVRCQERVEHRLPCREVHRRGARHDTVGVEHHRFERSPVRPHGRQRR